MSRTRLRQLTTNGRLGPIGAEILIPPQADQARGSLQIVVPQYRNKAVNKRYSSSWWRAAASATCGEASTIAEMNTVAPQHGGRRRKLYRLYRLYKEIENGMLYSIPFPLLNQSDAKA